MFRERMRALFLEAAIGPTEIGLCLQGILLGIWIIVVGVDVTFLQVVSNLKEIAPWLTFDNGRPLFTLIIVADGVRLWACLADRGAWRRWLARGFCAFWISLILVYLVAGVTANELPIYFANGLLNLWVQFRLDRRHVIHSGGVRSGVFS